MGESDPRRANHVDPVNQGTSNARLTQNLVADLRTALRSLRHSIQIAARRNEQEPLASDPEFDRPD